MPKSLTKLIIVCNGQISTLAKITTRVPPHLEHSKQTTKFNSSAGPLRAQREYLGFNPEPALDPSYLHRSTTSGPSPRQHLSGTMHSSTQTQMKELC